jgi:hypothetical protein
MEEIFLIRNEMNKKLKKAMINKNCQVNKRNNKCSKNFVSFVKIQNVLIIAKASVKELSIVNAVSVSNNKELHPIKKLQVSLI